MNEVVRGFPQFLQANSGIVPQSALDRFLPVLFNSSFINQPIIRRYTVQCRYWQRRKIKLNSVTLVRERTIPTERPTLVGKVSANFCG
jgi:hypothetical protein